jgi:hypothetical protein
MAVIIQERRRVTRMGSIGEYQTKWVILEMYGRMKQTLDADIQYQMIR